jgi:hypothetical protein
VPTRHGYWDAGANRWKRPAGTPPGPRYDPRTVVENAMEVRRRIDREFGADLLDARFGFFRAAEAAAVMPGLLLDGYPIEYGMHLCLEHAEVVPDLPPGYIARTPSPKNGPATPSRLTLDEASWSGTPCSAGYEWTQRASRCQRPAHPRPPTRRRPPQDKGQR